MAGKDFYLIFRPPPPPVGAVGGNNQLSTCFVIKATLALLNALIFDTSSGPDQRF